MESSIIKPRYYKRENELTINEFESIAKTNIDWVCKAIFEFRKNNVYMWVKQGQMSKKLFDSYMAYVEFTYDEIYI